MSSQNSMHVRCSQVVPERSAGFVAETLMPFVSSEQFFVDPSTNVVVGRNPTVQDRLQLALDVLLV